MKKIFHIIALLAIGVSCSNPQFDKKEFSTLRDCFANPPQSAKPMVWWHWMNGNITPEGLRNDILWMHAAGIGGFHVFDAALKTPQRGQERINDHGNAEY